MKIGVINFSHFFLPNSDPGPLSDSSSSAVLGTSDGVFLNKISFEFILETFWRFPFKTTVFGVRGDVDFIR